MPVMAQLPWKAYLIRAEWRTYAIELENLWGCYRTQHGRADVTLTIDRRIQEVAAAALAADVAQWSPLIGDIRRWLAIRI